MREIKFRGMDANNIMRYGRLSQDKENSTQYYKEYSQRICWDDSNIPVSNKSLGQFTGLLDKNGKEIYEGDVVRFTELIEGTKKPWIEEIAFVGTSFCAVNRKCCKSCSELKSATASVNELNSVCYGDIEVIGNIYEENPELKKEV